MDSKLPRPGPRRPAVWWRRRRVVVGGLGLLVLATIVTVMLSARSAAPAPIAAPVTAALVAHGQVVPVQQARVGTLGGGQVQQLTANLGAEVSAQTPLAWVLGPSGTEVVTAPFSGSVTNVLVHEGDTLMPGATIAVVANMHALQVETSDVDEFLVGHVSVGQRVEVTVDALDNLALAGVVTNIALLPQIGASGSPAYPVIVSLSGVPPAVHAGMSIRMTLPD
ncbi:MAG TPA: efflux RND transporter periplasmic adaptor subunit [Chloroflexota bacterium]|nr:efflux RND transporter periplasmic adaptor subunit [Chloroflexota bacterium]